MFGFAGFELDEQRLELRGPDGTAIKLRPKTFEMLRLFAANAGRVLSKQELMEAVWPNVHVGEDSLFQCIREIRTALGDDRRQLVKLVSGRGYLFAAQVSGAEVSTKPAGIPANTEAALSIQAADVEPVATCEPTAELTKSQRPLFGLRGPAAVATVACLCTIIGFAVAAPILRPDFIFKRTPPIIAVMPIVDASNDPRGPAMAEDVTDRLTDGFAKIDNTRVVASRSAATAAHPEYVSTPSESSDFEVRGLLQRGERSWILRARMIKTATGEIQSVATVSVDVDEPDVQLQQSRLAAGAGDLMARGLNRLLEAGESSAATGGSADGDAKVVIAEAVASINQTTRERFGMAQTMLQSALAAEPDNVDLAVALAALQLRGIQLVWYSRDEAVAAEAQVGATLERALRAKPTYIPVLEALLPLPHRDQPFRRRPRDLCQDAELRSVERTRVVPHRSGPDSIGTLRRRAHDVQASRPFRHAAGVALDLASWCRMGLHAHGPQRRSGPMAAAVDRHYAGVRALANAVGRGLPESGSDRRSKGDHERGVETATRHDGAQYRAVDEERQSGFSPGDRSGHPVHDRGGVAGALNPADNGSRRPCRVRDGSTNSRSSCALRQTQPESHTCCSRPS
ncbi:DNA-binding winged helix-turn-helix (wHTH) protein/TolB-like protein [Bradyrhizobium sp. AZCC 2289]